MKEIAIYFSLTGNSKKYVEDNYETSYEIKLNREFKGFFKFFKINKYSKNKLDANLVVDSIDFKKVDKVVFVGPTWHKQISRPIKEYMDLHKKDLKGKEVEIIKLNGKKEAVKEK